MSASLSNGELPRGPKDQAAPDESLRSSWIALCGLGAVFLVEMLDSSLLNVALPSIGRDLGASTAGLQWVTSIYSIAFGSLMLFFGALADRVGRKRIMLIGIGLLGVASLLTAVVTTTPELIGVRATMGIAAAMTTPGSLALAYRLFESDELRVRATTLISTIGLIGLAIGPALGGFVLAFAPWQVLLLVNVPIAALAGLCILGGIPRDDANGRHSAPLDVAGSLLGSATIVLLLSAPTAFIHEGVSALTPWLCVTGAIASGAVFVIWSRRSRNPLIDLALVRRPLVSSGLAYKAATGIATAGLGFFVTLQLQLAWGWTPFWAAVGMLPQVVVLLAGGVVVGPVVRRLGLDRVAWLSAGAVVVGLAIFAGLGWVGYPWVATSLILVALGIRFNGIVAGTNVLRGMPPTQTTMGAALVDTATEIASAIGVAIAGTVLAALFAGSMTSGGWSQENHSEFATATILGGAFLTVIAALLVAWGFFASKKNNEVSVRKR